MSDKTYEFQINSSRCLNDISRDKLNFERDWLEHKKLHKGGK